MSSDPKVEEIRARLAAATPGPWTVMIPDGEPYWIHSTGQTVLTKGIAFGDDAEFIANAPTDIALLLTKLDEAENALRSVPGYTSPPAFRGAVSELLREKQDAEERERALIAGVRELVIQMNDLVSDTDRNDFDRGQGNVAEHVRAILSRLLPSTPTEEGN